MDVPLCDGLLNSSKFQGVFFFQNMWHECKATAVEGRHTFNVSTALHSLSCVISTSTWPSQTSEKSMTLIRLCKNAESCLPRMPKDSFHVDQQNIPSPALIIRCRMKNDKHVALFVVSENIDWAKTQKNKSVYFFIFFTQKRFHFWTLSWGNWVKNLKKASWKTFRSVSLF